MSKIHNVTDATFAHEVLQSDRPVLVDFWAPWCGPCKSMAPYLDSIATELGDQVKIVKINVDENFHVPAGQGVRGIPTFQVFVDGTKVDTKVGAMNRQALQDLIARHIPEEVVEQTTTTTTSTYSNYDSGRGILDTVADVLIAEAVIEVAADVFESVADAVDSFFD